MIPLEPAHINKEMGRILLRRGGETVAAGKWSTRPGEVDSDLVFPACGRCRHCYHCVAGDRSLLWRSRRERKSGIEMYNPLTLYTDAKFN